MGKDAKKKRNVFFEIGVLLLFLGTILFIIYAGMNLTGHAISIVQPNATVSQDTYIREPLDANFGTSESLMVGKTTSGSEFRSLIKIDVSSIPNSDTITNAVLELYMDSSIGVSPQKVDVYLAPSNWTADSATWFRRTNSLNWTTAGGDYSQKIGSIDLTNQTGFYNLTITSTVNNWISGATTNYGIFLVANNPENGNYSSFVSSNSTNSSERPKLVITHFGNVPPTLLNMSTSSSATKPVENGKPVTFIANWSDYESDASRLIVCDSANITYNSGCSGTAFCTTSLAQTKPAQCNYTTKTTDAKQVPYYSAVCDSNSCSSIFNGTFYTDHAPTMNLTYPLGGETFNQSLGNSTINFTVSDLDNDFLTANLYYGNTPNSTTNLIATRLNLSKYCLNYDSKTSTPDACSYNWDTTGIYGDFYITAISNDSYYTGLDSTQNAVKIRSLIDTTPPAITGYSMQPTYSGKITQIIATIVEAHMKSAWVEFNYTNQNITMINNSERFVANFTAPKPGSYQYKIYAQDVIGNLDSTDWNTFTVSKPAAQSENENAPAVSLPHHVIEVSSTIKANDSLKGVSAYLNVPAGFTFTPSSPQLKTVENISSGQTKQFIWFVSTPMDEATYTINTTYYDIYQNSWQSPNTYLTTTSSIGGYQLTSNGYTQVQTTTNYFTNAYFEENGQYINPDTITIKIYDSSNNLVLGPVSMTKVSTGIYNYSYAVGTSVLQGEWQTIINATKGQKSYYAHEFWNVVGGPFDVKDILIHNNTNNKLNISLTTINTGGINQDLILQWNLTRVDNGAQLDSGADTFMVQANSQRNWTIYPITNYVGQVKITFVGYYAGGQKAGAYKIFSTTGTTSVPTNTPSSGSNGGGTSEGMQITNTNFNETLNQTNITNKIQASQTGTGTAAKATQTKTNKSTTTNITKAQGPGTTQKISSNLIYISLGVLIILILILIWFILKLSKKLRVLSIVKNMNSPKNKKTSKNKKFESRIRDLEKTLNKD